jgi:hypothetical protein
MPLNSHSHAAVTLSQHPDDIINLFLSHFSLKEIFLNLVVTEKSMQKTLINALSHLGGRKKRLLLDEFDVMASKILRLTLDENKKLLPTYTHQIFEIFDSEILDWDSRKSFKKTFRFLSIRNL